MTDRYLSRRVAGLKPSGIRKFFDITATMKDVISLGIGEPDFTTPEPILLAGIESLQRGETHYTSNYGILELRRELAAHFASQYGVEYDPSWRNDAGVSSTTRTGKVANDDRADWREAWALFPGDVAYVWHAGVHSRTVIESLEATGRLVVVDESPPRCGLTSDIAGLAASKGFHSLKAPVQQVCAPHSPTPFAPELEAAYLPDANKIMAAIRAALA